MEQRDIAAVVVTHDSAPYLEGTLAALETELSQRPGARRLVVDAASRDGCPALARARGWELLELDGSGATTPAAAREAGRRACTGGMILFVDGDVAVEPGFVAAAMAQLAADPGLAGVGGELRFDEGFGPPAPSASGPRRVPCLAALAVYRADALARVGGFVPWLESEEDADLGLRLRHSGYALLCIQPGGIHRSGPRQSWGETLRRLRAGLYYGQGRVLRLRFGTELFAGTLRRQALYVAVLAGWFAVKAALLAAVLGGARGLEPLPGAPSGSTGPRGTVVGIGLFALCMLAGAVLLAAARKRSLARGALSVFTWHVMAWGLLVGLVSAPRCREIRIKGPARSPA